ncbi:universal stress protein [Mycolicibacterium austroafricanum]|uniref:universal stress protein n=1 Tax=Mycolicibacterium austroafricanum TaxID=39687 RepID=UPI001CA35699|nr:universal stress protein [Mycolicibacterium austroafricanum]QZT63432.1 universal stress protein [Mycolicibacterium austroafricanum]
MSATVVAAVVVVWCLSGLLSGVWMARRGYDPLWILIALPLGLLFVPIAIERVQRRPTMGVPGADSSPLPARIPQGALARVLVGLDGSAEARAALTTASRLFGPHCELLVLAEVVRHEATEDEKRVEIDAASTRLAEAASAVAVAGAVRTEVLAGAAGPALRQYAMEQDMDVLVVGRRGRGLSRHVLGSVSAEVVEHSPVPILVVEPARNRPR